MRRLRKFLHILFWLLLSLYLAAAGSLLVVRYAVLPQVDRFRPAIERVASQALGAKVEISRVGADWRGLNARLALSGVRIQGDDGEVLSVPEAQAVMSWRSLLQWEPLFLYLEVRGLDLSVRRDAQGNIHLAGPQGQTASDDPQASERVLRWLGKQREWVVRDAVLRWRDERHDPQAPELLLSSVQARFINRFAHHAFGLSAALPAGADTAAGSLTLRGEFDRRWFEVLSRQPNWDARLYAGFTGVDLARWAAWLPARQAGLEQGQVSGQAWALVPDGVLEHVVLDLHARGLAWRTQAAALQAAAVDVYADGSPAALWQVPPPAAQADSQQQAGAALPAWLAPAREGQRVYADVALRDAAFWWPAEFGERRLPLRQASAVAELRGADAEGWSAAVRRLSLENEDLALALQGQWQQKAGSEAGWLDVQGTIARLSLPALHAYFPLVVPEETRHWLATALKAGELRQSDLELRGNLDDFPFEDAASEGTRFSLKGDFDGLTLDYAPAHGRYKGWPLVQSAKGRMDLLQNVLALELESGTVITGPANRLALNRAAASITDLYRQAAHLKVDAGLAGEARHYLALMQHSDLGEILAHTVLPQIAATGNWGMALKLDIPLMHSVDSQVSGSVALQGGQVEIKPEIPVFSALSGWLDFDNDGISARDIRGRFLGGAFSLGGKLTRKDIDAALNMEGALAADSLQRWLPPAAAARFGGEIPYQARLGMDAGDRLWLQVDSSLQGTTLDFPAPLGKAAQARRSVTLNWGPGEAAGSEVLAARIGGIGALRLEHDAARRDAYFWRGALVDGAVALALPVSGLAVDLHMPEFDWAAWDQVFTDFDDGKASGRPLLPGLASVKLAAERVHAFAAQWNQVRLQAERQARGGWRIAVQGDELDGTLDWRSQPEAQHPVLLAEFGRLAWPQAVGQASQSPTQEAPDWNISSAFRLPDLDLKINELSWRGKALGKLQARGKNRNMRGDWGLDSLVLGQPGAVLSATGNWQVEGPGRGLALNLNTAVSDLGKWLDVWGLDDAVRAGRGKATASLRWLDFPWRQDGRSLSGTVALDLEQGRFVHMRSRSARVLEILSLQSLSRVLSLDARPAEAFKDGFPFDSIVGTVQLAGPEMDIKTLTVDGPAAQVVLQGGTDLVQQRWNLQATVTPHLDVSGASVAAGFVVNPVVGVGAFVAQWLLKDPLARAMRLEYEVTGSWDDPSIEALEKEKPERASSPSAELHYAETGN